MCSDGEKRASVHVYTNCRFYLASENCGKSIKTPVEAADGKKEAEFMGNLVVGSGDRATTTTEKKSNKNQRTIDDNEVQANNSAH